MTADPFQTEVTRIALAVASAYGFALGGGNALIAHGLVDRPTEDIDLFTDADGGALAAADVVAGALRAAGLTVETVAATDDLADLFEGFDLDMVELEVRRDDDVVRLSLARLDRTRRPVMLDVGPVLHVEDVLGSKIAALASRAELRDFLDVAAALDRLRYRDLVQLALRIDPGLTSQDFADVGRRLDALPDRVFARYGLGPADVAKLRERFADWPRPT